MRWGPLARVSARFAVSGLLLALVARLLDLDQVIGRLRTLELRWVLLALVVSLAQVMILAWRWRFTASRLGLELDRRRAFGEYYLGIFLNQVLPGGVAGDVSRAWRHARATSRRGTAVWAVILERASGQVVMTAVALLCLLALPMASLGARATLIASVIAVIAAGVALLIAGPGRHAGIPHRLWADARRAVLARDAWAPQLASAAILVSSYVAVYVMAARAIGIPTPVTELLPLVPPVLMTMLIPVTVAGWGLREGAAAGLWALVGLGAEDGAAISVAYGLIVLVASLPGLVMLRRGAAAGRDRTGRPAPTGTDDSPGESPDRAIRSGPA